MVRLQEAYPLPLTTYPNPNLLLGLLLHHAGLVRARVRFRSPVRARGKGRGRGRMKGTGRIKVWVTDKSMVGVMVRAERACDDTRKVRAAVGVNKIRVKAMVKAEVKVRG